MLIPCAVVLAAAAAGSEAFCGNIPRPANAIQARVIRVIDGDTIGVGLPSGARDSVRFIGIDAPELHANRSRRQGTDPLNRPEVVRALGERARQFAVMWLAGRDVWLVFDAERRDRYGRLLAYVWLPGGASFNVLTVREGYAQVMTVPPNVRHAGVFLACEREARAAGRGLWAR